MDKSRYVILNGHPHPLGATVDKNGVNFAVFSMHATSIELLLFDTHYDKEPIMAVKLDPKVNKTFHFWHVYVKGLKPGVHYAYRVDGPFNLKNGHRFDKNKVLLDPYSKGVTNTLWNREDACTPVDNIATSMRSVIIDVSDYDWEGDRPLDRHMDNVIIYEMHVRGFTKSPASGCTNPGTFRGVIERIPYLKELGITAVELMPIFDFDDKEILRPGPNGEVLTNYWGYSTINYFAPNSGYCTLPEVGNQINEIRDMVKALHREGIEIILDVVFNHTGEGNHQGPTVNFKGFDNSIYYHLVKNDRQYYMDYSGCGNTVNCNHPIVEKFIVECLEFWVKEIHIDGFRFDEGSILTRGEDGAPMVYPPVVWQIELSETLADTKIIAEAWDAAGLYQIGYFPGYRWAEWNGRFRDDIRRFIKGDPGLINAVASRIAGSSDVYQSSGHLPINSVNFITCHDGFTLNDLFSYNYKHNEANGENNRDGINENYSWNCGLEGETEDPQIENLRKKLVKNSVVILLLSQGIPMILSGDEARRTQKGNNNTYCQDNELNWFDWTLIEKNRDIFLFFKKMISFRKRHPILHRKRFFDGQVNERGLKDMEWHGCKLFSPGWDDPDGRALAFTMGDFSQNSDIHVMMNMYWDELEFEIPLVKGRWWYRSVDTSLGSPDDILEPGTEELVRSSTYSVKGRSIVVLISR